jgi:hypothetical protein
VIINSIRWIYWNKRQRKSQKAEGYKYPALLFFIQWSLCFFLSTRHTLSALSSSARVPVTGEGGRRWRHRLLRRPQRKNNQKLKLFTSNLTVFSHLIQIQKPNFKKTHRSTVSEQKMFEEKISFLSSVFVSFFSFSFCFRFGLLVVLVIVFLDSLWFDESGVVLDYGFGSWLQWWFWVLFDVRILLVKWWCYWFLLFGCGVGYWWDFCVLLLMNFFRSLFLCSPTSIYSDKEIVWMCLYEFPNSSTVRILQCVKSVHSIFFSQALSLCTKKATS